MSTENEVIKGNKPTYKKWWVWVIGILLVVGLANVLSDKPSTVPNEAPRETPQQELSNPAEVENEAVEPEPIPEPDPEPEVSTEFRNALITAQNYSDNMHMSKKRLFGQLTSEYGEGFPKDAAQYAVDNVEADWKYNALKTAENYYENMAMSKDRVFSQLTSEYGEGFTKKQAQYAVDNLD